MLLQLVTYQNCCFKEMFCNFKVVVKVEYFCQKSEKDFKFKNDFIEKRTLAYCISKFTKFCINSNKRTIDKYKSK